MKYGWEIADEVQRFAGNSADMQFVPKSELDEAESEIHDLRERLKNEADSYRTVINGQKNILAATLSKNAKLVEAIEDLRLDSTEAAWFVEYYLDSALATHANAEGK